MSFDLRVIQSSFFNKWQMKRHYLRRPIIKSKMLAHGIFIDDLLVGGLLWVTPHFTKKSGLFGYPGLFDKWEVLVLGRFYLSDSSGLIASEIMAESIGKGNRGARKRGWRIQQDWVLNNPPINPDNPFVPRLLMSWSDSKYGHTGTIYRASGWKMFDETNSNGQRSIKNSGDNSGLKKCWVLELEENKLIGEIGASMKERYQPCLF